MRHLKPISPRLSITSLVILFLAGAAVTAHAQVPDAITYQGYLTDADGAPIDEDDATLTFRLFDAASGGTAGWTETQTGVTVDDGVFSVMLGAVESLEDVDFDRPLWLSVAVGDASAEQLEPRLALASTPYSLHARTVADGGVTGSSIADGHVVRSLNGLTDAVSLEAGENVTLSSDGNTVTIAAAADLEQYLLRDGSQPMLGTLDMDSHQITNLAMATSPGDAIPFGQSAGGDLSDTYPSPRVVGLQGRALASMSDGSSTAPADGQVLTWSGGESRWQPQDVPDGFSLPFTSTVESSDAPAFEVRNTGSRSAANFVVDNPSNFNSAVLASTNGIGATIFARTFGSGRAGLFRIDNNNNTNPAVEVVSSSSQAGSVALVANHSGSQPDADIAVFQANNAAVARIDKNGTGYFNGGTETNGADVAEAFDVEGTSDSYEPGDVLVISTRSDRRVTRTDEAYSSLVVGVYATKPGVLLTERGIDEGLGSQIPMGVIGVVPTKVSAENGPIRRGDLLVTASQAGHAMKGTDHTRMLGAILGKALENFEGPGTGVIKVMVNAR